MRRFMVLFCAAMLLCIPFAAKAEGTGEEKAYLLMPLYGETVLEEKNADRPYSVAGLGKLPAILALCHAFDTGLIQPDTRMEVSQKASKVTGPTAFLDAGEKVAAGELMKAAVMISAGDAIWTLMENAFGSEDIFLQNIGVILKETGVDVQMESCLGTGAAFSCHDLLALGTYAADSETFLSYAGSYMDHLRHESGSSTELVNANRMIRTYAGCCGLMTGSSRDDGYCGVFLTTRNDMTYLCCVIGSPTSEKRFERATQLFDYAFANFRSEMPAEKDVPLLTEYPVLYGDQKNVDLVPHETTVLLLNKSDGAIEPVFNLPEALSAPLLTEESVGTVSFVRTNGETVCTVELFPSVNVESHGFVDVLRRMLAGYFA